jgi:uncharacterized OsmC-like protein/pimeloyl-ACP methyl ester carboxylesterase
MHARQLDFIGAAGQQLSGRLDLPDGPVRGFALFAHCFTCTKRSVAAVRIGRALTARGIGVFRFDFTGLGDSGGNFAESTFSGDIRDLAAAAHAMAQEGFPPKLLIGHSLGGAAVLAAAGELPEIAAVAVIAAPFDVQHLTSLFKGELQEILDRGEVEVDIGGRPFTMRRSFIEDLQRHDQAARIAQLRRPLLVLQSPIDQIVGIENASAIFQAARHPKSFVSLDDADHLLTRSADAEYAAEVIAAWASRYLAPAATAAAAVVPGQVEVQNTGNGRFQVEVLAGGARFYADEPVAAGGLASGPSPYELLSAGLGACTVMTLRLYAEHKQWPLSLVRATVCHSKSSERTPADRFTRTIHLEGELDAAQRARLLEIADRCPVHRTLEAGATMDTRAADLLPESSEDQHLRDMEATCADAL